MTWWEFVASVLITIAATAGMAIFAARIYRRAVLAPAVGCASSSCVTADPR